MALATEAALLTGIRVLIADDDAELRELVTGVLERSGAVVCAVSRGSEALQQLPVFDPDLILTDLDMPGMNGTALLLAIRAGSDPRWRAIPAAVLTGSEDGTEELMALGFKAVLRKPVIGELLCSTLAEMAREPRSAAR